MIGMTLVVDKLLADALEDFARETRALQTALSEGSLGAIARQGQAREEAGAKVAHLVLMMLIERQQNEHVRHELRDLGWPLPTALWDLSDLKRPDETIRDKVGGVELRPMGSPITSGPPQVEPMRWFMQPDGRPHLVTLTSDVHDPKVVRAFVDATEVPMDAVERRFGIVVSKPVPPGGTFLVSRVKDTLTGDTYQEVEEVVDGDRDGALQRLWNKLSEAKRLGAGVQCQECGVLTRATVNGRCCWCRRERP